ncbi:MAG: hypothetical protein AAFX76_05845 [Planctomycetota bacterium]
MIFSDSFEASAAGDASAGVYSAGSVFGQAPDVVGYASSPWINPGRGVDSARVIEDGLTYKGYGGSGGAIEVSESANFAQFVRGGDLNLGELFAPDGTGTLFVSALVQPDSNDPSRVAVSLATNGDPGGAFIFGSAIPGQGGSSAGDGEIVTNFGGEITLSGELLNPGRPNLLVMQINVTAESGGGEANDDVFIYLNPDLSRPLDTSSAIIRVSGVDLIRDSTPVGQFQFQVGGNAEGTTLIVDELRIGTSFDSMDPEPGGMALAASTGVLYWVRRRGARHAGLS